MDGFHQRLDEVGAMSSDGPAVSTGSGIRSCLIAALTRAVVEPALRAPYLRTARWLTEFHQWPEQQRRHWRLQRMRAVLRHAQAHVPYYRELLGQRDVGTVELGELPVVDKAMMRECMDRYLSQGWRDIPHIAKRTGGSTGDPWQYPLDKQAWVQMYAANLYLFERTGYRYGERIVLLGSPPSLCPEGADWKVRMRFALEGRVVAVEGVSIDAATSRDRVLAAGRARGSVWYGYASSVAAMADVALQENIRLAAPKAIITTSEPLFSSWRERIERAFRAPVRDFYGCNDGGVLALSCPRGRLHIAENVSLVEVLNEAGRRCEPGEEGDVVVTNLHARTLPFLRYRIGDRAVLGEGRCTCGSPGEFLERVTGRHGDTLRLPDRRHIPMPALTRCFRDAKHVRRWQFVQREPKRVQVRMDVDPEFDAAERAMITAAIRLLVGDALDLDLTTDEPLERTAGGKHRVVVRTFNA